MQRVAVYGATGSIGASALDVIARHPEAMRASVLAAGSKVGELVELCRRTVRERFGYELELEQCLCPFCPDHE